MNLQDLLKVAITAVLVVAIAKVSARNTMIGGLLASLPLTSVLAMIWLHVDTGDTEKIAALSTSIFWLVLPSLTLFLVLPVLLRKGLPFPGSLTIACAATIVAYGVVVRVLTSVGVRI